MPAATRQRYPVFPTPDLRDLIFWERDTLSRDDYTDLVNSGTKAYGTAHYDTDRFPNHVLCYWKPDADYDMGRDGQDSLRVIKYYVADRADQDKYNFEFTAADIGGQKFNAVKRTIVTPRDDWSESTPAMGTAMSREPSDKFPEGYVLAQRQQSRTGEAELDALYVTEVQVYVEKTTITDQSYDEATNGVLAEGRTLYYRGETYTPAADTIENAAADPTQWGVSAAGVLTEVKQLSDNWWMVVSKDVIPQDKNTTGNKFGGIVLRSYDTYRTTFWPGVLSEIEIMDWVDKDGNARNYPRPVYHRQPYRGPTRLSIVEEWSDTAPSVSGSSNRPVALLGEPIVYASPYLAVNLPATLHSLVAIVCDTSSSDPVWGANSGSRREYGPTTFTDWPSSYTVDVDVNPFRGGYLTRHVTANVPEETAT